MHNFCALISLFLSNKCIFIKESDAKEVILLNFIVIENVFEL